MYANLAQLGLVLSILLSLLVPFGFIWLKPISNKKFKCLLDNIILFQFILISFAFISLIYAYVISDFSLYNVYRNSHVAVPLIYKFSGAWSNHEGSMILWIFLLGLVNFISTQHKLPNLDRIWISATQIIITSSLLAYTILKSNPFVKMAPIPEQGRGFNPLLQDIGLAIHPPILYMGYIATVVPFALAISALINKKLSPTLLEIMQKWALFAWSFLSLGVALGSWWAYRELGWGGYWFWDPVENASLLPWLTSSALIHSIYASKKLNTNYKWTILLAISTFLLSILSTFLVRSGVVTSVHSFASDPNRGIFILSLLCSYSITALGLFAAKAHHLNSSDNNKWLSRFGGINIANILWSIATAIILLSLLYPLGLEHYTGKQITIDASFFESSFIPVLLPILLLLALTLPASWTEILPVHYRHFTYSFIVASIISIIFYYFAINIPSLITIGAFFVGSLVVIRMIFWFKQRMATPLTIKFYLIWLVHMAAGLFVMNIAFIESNSQELLVKLEEGDKVKFAAFDIHYTNKENIAIDNYLAGKVILHLEKNHKEIAILKPEIRFYPVERSQTSETAVYNHYLYDLSAVINEITKEGVIGIKLYFRPLISWLWIISSIFFTCGILLLITNKKKSNANS